MISILYNDLKTLISSSSLVPEEQYRITDYVTTVSKANYTSAGYKFDIVVTALTTNVLYEYATLMANATETYFDANSFSLYNIKYNINNEIPGYANDWVDANGKGCIYYMTDNKGNEAPYDFKNIKHNGKFLFNNVVDGSDTSLTISEYNSVKEVIEDGVFKIPLVSFNNGCRNVTIDTNASEVSITECNNLQIGNNCSNSEFSEVSNVVVGSDVIDSELTLINGGEIGDNNNGIIATNQTNLIVKDNNTNVTLGGGSNGVIIDSNNTNITIGTNAKDVYINASKTIDLGNNVEQFNISSSYDVVVADDCKLFTLNETNHLTSTSDCHSITTISNDYVTLTEAVTNVTISEGLNNLVLDGSKLIGTDSKTITKQDEKVVVINEQTNSEVVLVEDGTTTSNPNSYITDSPADGLIYGRKDGDWTEIDTSGDYEVTYDDVVDALTYVPISTDQIGVANGLAMLDAQGYVLNAQLPSYVDDIIEVDTFTLLPVTGEKGKIYIVTDSGKTYRWATTQYVTISESLTLGTGSEQAYPGNLGAALRIDVDNKAPLSGVPKYTIGGTSYSVASYNLRFQAANEVLIKTSIPWNTVYNVPNVKIVGTTTSGPLELMISWYLSGSGFVNSSYTMTGTPKLDVKLFSYMNGGNKFVGICLLGYQSNLEYSVSIQQEQGTIYKDGWTIETNATNNTVYTTLTDSFTVPFKFTPHIHTKSEVGLDNVDNTSDTDKPVSTATQTALNGKANTLHTHTKSEVGLANVDNTSDLTKPISTATQTALDLKASQSDIDTAINAIEVGGRNLIPNTKDLTGYTYRTSDKYLGFNIARTTKGATGYLDTFAAITIDIAAGSTYVASFYAKASVNTPMQCHWYSPNTTTSALTSTGYASTSVDGGVTIVVTTEWKKYWVVWTQTLTELPKRLIIGRNATTAGAVLEIAGVKLEKGNKATDWTPAPEDNNEDIEYLKTNKANKSHTHDTNAITSGDLSLDRLSKMKKYVASRGENLVTNGTGLLKDNTNFSRMTYTGEDSYNCDGSFTTASGSWLLTDESMPVNPDLSYRLLYYIKAKPWVNSSVLAGIACFDTDGLEILPHMTMYVTNTLTTLAADLKNGDTTVKFTNLTNNWVNIASVGTHTRTLIFWNYVDSYGKSYPELTYSRNAFQNSWDPGAVNYTTNTITLNKPWSNGTIVAGTKVSNGNSGGTYKYLADHNYKPTTEWTSQSDIISGIDHSGNNYLKSFHPGTASIRLVFGLNRDVAGGQHYISNISFAVDTVTTNTFASHIESNLHLTEGQRTKLEGIAAGAEVNVNADWNATTGDAQILNKPASMPASDVYTWAKASTKPSYTASEIGGLDTNYRWLTDNYIATWNAKEPAITKLTAFNKNFGTTAGTVSEGNHTHTFASLTNKPNTLSGYGITDTPSDNKTYGRKNGGWSEIVTSGGGITDAPSDNKTYGRQNTTWVEINTSGGGGGDSSTISITWSVLKSLRDDGLLVPGQSYRITDYDCTTTTTDSRSAGKLFDIIVTALDEDQLSENASATYQSGDTYFKNAKLESWELKYCIDNDATRFEWANTVNGKGVIYYMKDNYNNEVPYDFKNIQFKKNNVWVYTFGGETDNSVVASSSSGFQYCRNNIIGVYKLVDYYYKFKLSFNTFGLGCYNNKLGNSCYNNEFGQSCYYNVFGDGCYNNTFGNACHSNTFGNKCFSNTFDEYCNSNTFGNDCRYNTFGLNCKSNTFGNTCWYNNFYHGSSGTTPKNYLQYIVLEDAVCYNNFYLITSTSTNNYLQRIRIKGLQHTTATKTQISLTSLNSKYEWVVCYKSGNVLKQYCPDD